MADIHENKKADSAGKPEEGNANAGVRDPKNKAGQLEQHPRKGRTRPPSSQDEIEDDPKENTESQERVRIQQGHKNHRKNTN